MAYPKKVAAVFVDSKDILFAEVVVFIEKAIGLVFCINDDQSSVGSYIKIFVAVIVHISDEKLSGAIQNCVELLGFGVQPLNVTSHCPYPYITIFVDFYCIYVVFEQVAVAYCILFDFPF